MGHNQEKTVTKENGHRYAVSILISVKSIIARDNSYGKIFLFGSMITWHYWKQLTTHIIRYVNT